MVYSTQPTNINDGNCVGSLEFCKAHSTQFHLFLLEPIVLGFLLNTIENENSKYYSSSQEQEQRSSE